MKRSIRSVLLASIAFSSVTLLGGEEVVVSPSEVVVSPPKEESNHIVDGIDAQFYRDYLDGKIKGVTLTPFQE